MPGPRCTRISLTNRHPVGNSLIPDMMYIELSEVGIFYMHLRCHVIFSVIGLLIHFLENIVY
jgi:hypothetical protein